MVRILKENFVGTEEMPTFFRQYEPLNEITFGKNDHKDARLLARSIMDPFGRGSLGNTEKLATTFLVALILHTVYTQKNKSFQGMIDKLTDTKSSIYDLLEEMKLGQGWNYRWKEIKAGLPTKVHPIVKSVVQEMSSKNKMDLYLIINTAVLNLQVFPGTGKSREVIKISNER
jgi:hypothetical protein